MDKLKKDNDTLKEELALETKQAMASNSSAAAAQIAKLQDQADTYTRKIEMEKRRSEAKAKLFPLDSGCPNSCSKTTFQKLRNATEFWNKPWIHPLHRG